MNDIYVSIFMLTYNQEEFIVQAIEGVMMQKTTFPFQLVIGEDCSTDRTRAICIDYAEKYPDGIKLLQHSANLGLAANYVETYKACDGKYIAICDGDDYWVDPYKLQKQIDLIKNQPAYKIIFTSNFRLFRSGKKLGPKKEKPQERTSFKELIRGNYIPSVTVLFEKVPLSCTMEKWFLELPYCDWPTYLLTTASGGEIFFLDEPTAVYRVDAGTSIKLRERRSQMGEINLRILENLKLEEVFKNREKEIGDAVTNIKAGLMATYNKEGKYLKSLRFLLDLISVKNRSWVLRLYVYSLMRAFIEK